MKLSIERNAQKSCLPFTARSLPLISLLFHAIPAEPNLYHSMPGQFFLFDAPLHTKKKKMLSAFFSNGDLPYTYD